MKKRTLTVKRLLALLLAVTMLFGMAACGKQPEESLRAPAQEQPVTEQPEPMTREDMQTIVEVVGGGEKTEDLSDEELERLVEELIGDMDQTSSGVVNLGSTQKTEQPTVDVTENKGVYDENGAMTEPFDQVYPELIEKEQVAFSGQSILIKLKKNTLTDGLKAAGVGALEAIVPLEGAAWYEAKLTEGTDAKAALAAVRELDEVLLAEYNYEIQTAALDHYKDFDKDHKEKFDKNHHHKDQWHMHHCGIPDAFGKMETEGGSPSVVVAVIDSGVDYDHEDLKDNMWVNAGEIPDNNMDDDGNGYVDDYYGVDVVTRKGSGDDTNGHGTHVAGIIAGQNNNLGIVGIAYNVKIMSVKAAMHNGTLNQADIARAVLYAYEMGAEVINMSFGGTACSIAVQDALATAYTRCVLVASAGNNGAKNEGVLAMPNYPAALTYVLGVMSVDETGTESVFTNWDVQAFNGVEYELYAPGENIMSTLPNNRYGFLSGTSMAAPVVSAFAAILRSEFADRDKYPTKFIYGQLAATSGNRAHCLDPEKHGIHNLPQIANLHDALTKLPKPEVNLQDYALFDDPKYSDKNNGDGVIDAGETIALGLTLRNRWGMSENTLVTVDTKSAISGIADPYFTFKNPTMDYGSVGTYSTQDCGRIYTDELLTGWKDPFIIEVSPDCPNDYCFTLNVTITCENALDEADTATYTTYGAVNENVRMGFILPSIIEEDMVLTPDKLYIIPNATIIREGVTVRVEPGTHIQFWSDDADDPYADSYIAYLVVNGKFLVEGTKENPVHIYPSQLRDRYNVEFGSTATGYVSLKYAELTNFMCNVSNSGTYNRINLAEHCTFRINYADYFRERYVSQGVVYTNGSSSAYIGELSAKDCVFYKLGLSSQLRLQGNIDRCVFTQCGIRFEQDSYRDFTYTNCVFLGNSLVDQTNPDRYMNSSINALRPIEELSKETVSNNIDLLRTVYRPETGTTYVIAQDYGNAGLLQRYVRWLKEAFGGDYVKIETAEEQQWLNANGVAGQVGVRWNVLLERYEWSDGTPVDLELFPNMGTRLGLDDSCICVNGNVMYYEVFHAAVFEIPGQVLPENITFAEYAVNLDMESTYQLSPRNTPVQLHVTDFLYESSDEAVITVSSAGIVTPVGPGTADVWVWTVDKAIRNRVTFTVKDYVAPDALSLSAASDRLAIGETLLLESVLTPADTTRKHVTYTSSDETIAAVDESGMVTGLASGKVTVTAVCEGITDTLELTVYRKATSLALESVAVSAALEDATIALPGVQLSNGAEAQLTWRTTDAAVAVVEDGKLTLKSEGTTTLIVTDQNSEMSDACLVIVSNEQASLVKKVDVAGYQHWVLLTDGSVYMWDTSNATPVFVTSGAQDISAYTNRCMILKNTGALERWYSNGYDKPYCHEYHSNFKDWKLKKVEASLYNLWVCTEDGSVYAMGTGNSHGQLGTGNVQDATEPVLINLDGVVDVRNSGDLTLFLTETGELYAAGDLRYTVTADPVLMDTGVSQILDSYYSNYIQYLTDQGRQRYIELQETGKWRYTSTLSLSDMDQVAAYGTNYGIAIKDGRVYTYHQYSLAPTPVPGITDAVTVEVDNGTYYVGTASGLLLGFGENPVNANHMAGVTIETVVKTPVVIPLSAVAQETVCLTESNLTEGVLSESTLELVFNKQIQTASAKLYADGTQITLQNAVKDYNRITVSRTNGFKEGVQYELVFLVGHLTAAGGIANTEQLRIPFTYTPPQQEETTAPVVYDAIVDKTVERVMNRYSFIDKLDAFIAKTGYNPAFTGNAILNPISTDTEVTHWLRVQAPTVTKVGDYEEIPLAGNYWGSTNERAIGLQMVDYSDFPNYARLMYAPYLTKAPENTFPFVTSVKLYNKDGEEVTTVGNETVTFRITFNRDMDTSIPLLVRFGSAYPYGDYEFEGKYVDPRTWEGTYTLNTLIENGYQYFTISNGCSATEDLPLQLDQARFFFEIDTTAAQALIMQGAATDTGIELKWTQDDFDTLMGYNVYRSDAEDGYYQRLNSTVIPAETMEFFDDTVLPGKVYYYNFTVVQTDMSESEPSGKIVLMSKDTMAPNIYHTPAYTATFGQNLIVSAEITDNLNVAYANLYFRVAGTQQWKIARMNSLNAKYSAIIPATELSMDGMEYYIEAFDGVSYTYRGSAEKPYTITVKEALGTDALGDVDGDGAVTNRDALILLQAISDKYNMNDEEFKRADLNGDSILSAVEALRILHYVSGKVGSLVM